MTRFERRRDMRFLYVAPRFHTNQIPIMKGLVENGHEVKFISHYAGKIEDYTYVQPVVAGYSLWFRMFARIYMAVKRKDPYGGDIKLKWGFPPFFRLLILMRDFSPDVVILRERSVYSIFAYAVCRLYGYPSILYNQSPLWEDRIKEDLPHVLMRRITPGVRMTPVYGVQSPDQVKNKVVEKGAYFVPFVMEPKVDFKNKQFFRDGVIRIFSIGKYEERKNHKMLVKVLSELPPDFIFTLTIAGECTSPYHENYFHELEELVKYTGMQKKVRLYKNLSRKQVEEEYGRADLFVIPSTREPASISQIEAMAFALPVLCSDKNGTACYVQDQVNGCLFRDNEEASLKEKLLFMMQDPRALERMGGKSLCLIRENCGFDVYFKGIEEILHGMES